MCDQLERRCLNDNYFADRFNTSGVVSAESSLFVLRSSEVHPDCDELYHTERNQCK